MDINESLQRAEQILSTWAPVALHPSPERVDVSLPDKWLKAAVLALRDAKWGYLSAITGMDHPGTVEPVTEEQRWQRLENEGENATGGESREGTLEVLYHFCEGAAVLTLRVSVRYSFPVLPSICGIIPAATLYERELSEMFGIAITGSLDNEHLYLPEGWPANLYPLRKDAPLANLEPDPKGL